MRQASARAAREVRRDTPLRRARTCYGHLAGVAGVELLDALLCRGWLVAEEGSRPLYRLTPEGRQALLARGVALPPAGTQRRNVGRGCTDWTERRPHLRGALGTAVVRALVEAGVLSREEGSRAVTLRQPLGAWLNSAGEGVGGQLRAHGEPTPLARVRERGWG